MEDVTMNVRGVMRAFPTLMRIGFAEAVAYRAEMFVWILATTMPLVTLAFHMESSLKVMDAWIAATFVFSGYLIPIEIFPGVLRTIADWLPFRYQIGFPVEVAIGAHDRTQALVMLGKQWAFVAGAFV